MSAKPAEHGEEHRTTDATRRPTEDEATRRDTGQARFRQARERGASAEPALQRSILCVDDDQSFARVLANRLMELGYAVDTAPDGETGVAKILVCNLMMPRKEGLELLEKFRQAGPQYSELPLILLTGRRDRDCRRLGADDCLAKALDLEMLEAVAESRPRRSEGPARSDAGIYLTNREK